MTTLIQKKHIDRSTRRLISPEFRELLKIVDEMKPILQASLTNGINVFKENIDLKLIARLYEAGDFAGIEQALEIDGLAAQLRPRVERNLTKTVQLSAQKTKKFFDKAIRRLIPGVGVPKPFDISNPRILRFIEKQTGELMVNITDTTLANVKRIISDGFNRGLPGRVVSPTIRGVVGLTDRQAIAAERFRFNLEEGNLTRLTQFQRKTVAPHLGRGVKNINFDKPNILDQFKIAVNRQKLTTMVDRYEQRHLKVRSDMVADTEASFAMNFGQQEVWEQNAQEGLFDRNKALKVWLTVPDDKLDKKMCAPLDGVAVPLDQTFDVPTVGPQLAPPAHPKCRCLMELDLGDEDE